MHLTRCIIVPNMTPAQCTAIRKCVCMCLHNTPLKAWEKQALTKMVRVVRSAPHSMKSIFEHHAKNYCLLASRPQCSCLTLPLSDVPPESILAVEGHRALVPITIRLPSGAVMRPKDPAAIRGLQARERAISGVKTFASQVGGRVPNLEKHLPLTIFQESGSFLCTVQNQASLLCDHFYVRIVDKGAGEMWGFCKQWVWDSAEEFLKKEKYIPYPTTVANVASHVSKVISAIGIPGNPKSQMCLMYLIAKMKSIQKGEWLWRPIASLPQLVISKPHLTLWARAMTRFWSLRSSDSSSTCVTKFLLPSLFSL